MTTISLPQAPWELARNKRSLIVSATQIENKRRCRRLWWFEKVRRLPLPPGKPQVFGTVLHAVAERYLRADDLGRDTNGDPVNLYPDGWHIAYDRFDPKKIEGEISPAEQAHCQKLISAAIENGVLERRKDRGVERRFTYPVFECDGVKVTMFGFIDLEHVGEIQDHKTTSAMKWAKSPAKLKENIQMLIYAKMHLEFLKERGAAMPVEVNLRHNYYCKDWKKPEVRKVEVRVTVAEIEEAWIEVEDDIREMVRLRDTIEDGLSEIPDPDMTHDNPCMAYGGCAYRRICGGVESIETYQQRLDSYANGSYIDPQAQAAQPAMFAKPSNTKDQNMDFAAKLAAIKEGKKNGGKEVLTAPPTMAPPSLTPDAGEGTSDSPSPTQRVNESVAPDVPSSGSAPPWTVEGCPACKGIGFNSKGSACRICEHKSGIMCAEFQLIPNDDGTVTWINNINSELCGVSPYPGQEAPAKATEQDAATEPVVIATEPEPIPTTSKKKRRSTKIGKKVTDSGFTLCINCGPTFNGNGQEILYLCDLLKTVGKAMAEENDVDDFHDINNFDRRDALRKYGKVIADDLGGKFVVAELIGTGESDAKALLDAIRPHASLVLVPNVV